MEVVRTPDFFVIGAYKCATTTLHGALRAHPGLFVPAYKEPNFYAFAHDLGPEVRPLMGLDRAEDYHRLFAPAPPGAVVGEVSPAYLAVPGTAARLHAAAPGARLVLTLRDPVARAFSDFLMYRRDGREPLDDFGAALDEQDARASRGLPTGRYLSTGFYGRQLAEWLRLFPAEQVLTLFADHPELTLDEQLPCVWDFLGAEPHVLPDADVRLNASSPGPRMREQDAARLRALYREDVTLLEDLVGRSVPWWRRD